MMTTPNAGAHEQHESPMDLPFSLAKVEGLEHVVLSDGSQILRVDDNLPYPDYDEPSMMHELLLEPRITTDPAIDLNRHEFLLPANYVTLGQALNDAIGYPGSHSSVELVTQLFSELGLTLAQIGTVDKQLPKDLDYSKIIFLRENMGLKLLPPLEVIDVKNPSEAQAVATKSLWDSLARAAVTGYQRKTAAEAFSGFRNWFKLV